MPSKTKKKNVLITGASSGIGKAIVLKLAREGYHVMSCARQIEKLEKISRGLTIEGLTVSPFQVDLRSEDSIKRMFKVIKIKHGGVNFLINCAGIGYKAPLIDAPTQQWKEMIDVNVLALCICNREALKDMLNNGDEGHIINISSLSGHRVYKEGGIYAATKFSITALTESLRLELRTRGSGIKVTQISPGLVKTKFHENYYKNKSTAKDIYSNFEPLNGDDIARAVSYVLSEPNNVQVHDILLRPLNQPG